MPRKPSDKRLKLVNSAIQLAYRQGFGETTIADVAQHADVPLGNVYFYFKSKDDLGAAIVANMLAYFDHLKEGFEAHSNPRQRLIAYVRMTNDNRENISVSGCPVGTFCSEMAKDKTPLSDLSAQLFKVSLAWTEAQFSLIVGDALARNHAIQLMSSLQGVSELAHVFHDPSLVSLEAERVSKWIESL